MAKASNKELNDKQKAFCREYIIDFNGTQAAVRAGYSKKCAKEQAARLLTNANIQKLLSELKLQAASEFGVSKQDLVNELKKISFFDIRRIFNDDNTMKSVSDFDDGSAAAVAGIENDDIYEFNGITKQKEFIGYTRKVKVASKIAAIERLSKMLGYDAPEKKEVTGKDGKELVPLAINLSPAPNCEPLNND